MDLLCAHHAKNRDSCKWVIEHCDKNTENLTVKAWLLSCKKYLEDTEEDMIV